MARNEIVVNAPRSAVFEALTDPSAYVQWVVGGRRLRAVDEAWPQPGSAFYHEVGVAPFVLRDCTRMLEYAPGERVVLDAKARPLGTAIVDIRLHGDDGGTRVVLDEVPSGGPLRLVPRPLIDALTRVRNAKSLQRLRDLVEERAGATAPG